MLSALYCSMKQAQPHVLRVLRLIRWAGAVTSAWTSDPANVHMVWAHLETPIPEVGVQLNASGLSALWHLLHYCWGYWGSSPQRSQPFQKEPPQISAHLLLHKSWRGQCSSVGITRVARSTQEAATCPRREDDGLPGPTLQSPLVAQSLACLCGLHLPVVQS